MGVVGGAYSGMVRISNCEIREMVILRYVGILVIGLMCDCLRLYAVVVVAKKCCQVGKISRPYSP